jgi:hypothetical protein
MEPGSFGPKNQEKNDEVLPHTWVARPLLHHVPAFQAQQGSHHAHSLQVMLHALKPLAPIISHPNLVRSEFQGQVQIPCSTPHTSQLDTYARILLAWYLQWGQKGSPWKISPPRELAKRQTLGN